MKKIYIGLILFIFSLSLIAQHQRTHQKKYHAGYTAIQLVDSLRQYKPGVSTTDPLYYRTVVMDLWYPAKAFPSDSTLTYGDLLKTFRQRAELYTGQPYPALDTNIAAYLVKTFGGNDSLTLLNQLTSSGKNAPQQKGKFPLIIYLSSYNGTSHENIDLFEALAQSGYVVAVITSIGRFPGDMTMQLADLIEQVNDARFTQQFLVKKNFIDSTNIGLAGYSWGGPATAILAADAVPEYKAVVSLDGSEMHVYDEPSEDSLWNIIQYTALANANKKHYPYLYISSDRRAGRPDSVSYLRRPDNLSQYLQLDSATHTDFACYTTYIESEKNYRSRSIHQLAIDACLYFFEAHLRKKHNAFNIFKSKYVGKGITEELPYSNN
jgi:dienelactone hydrolase